MNPNEAEDLYRVLHDRWPGSFPPCDNGPGHRSWLDYLHKQPHEPAVHAITRLVHGDDPAPSRGQLNAAIAAALRPRPQREERRPALRVLPDPIVPKTEGVKWARELREKLRRGPCTGPAAAPSTGEPGS